MSPKQNFLEAVRFGNPEYVPLGRESILEIISLDGLYPPCGRPDFWGVKWEAGFEGTFPFPKGHPITSLDQLAEYQFPSADAPRYTPEVKARYESIDRDRRIVLGCVIQLLFEKAWAVMGMDNFLAGLATQPEAAREYLHRIASFARGVYDRYLDLGFDGAACTEDLGSQRALMISPRMFREFFLPEYEYIFENVRKAGKIIYFHSCGQIHDIAADLASIGITILDPVQALANDLARIKAATVGRTALRGAIDTALLASGSPGQIAAEVGRVTGILKPGGGWVCAPDQQIPGIPEENMDALWSAARRLGRY